MKRIKSDTQDSYMPDSGVVDEASCGVCGAKMLVTRDQHGPTSFVSAMAKSKRHYDHFQCPHRGQDWHKKVIDIRQFLKGVPSDYLRNVMKIEVNQILRDAWEEAKGLDPSGEMWLQPDMHETADQMQREWGLWGHSHS